jgi:hypothetical protein
MLESRQQIIYIRFTIMYYNIYIYVVPGVITIFYNI